MASSSSCTRAGTTLRPVAEPGLWRPAALLALCGLAIACSRDAPPQPEPQQTPAEADAVVVYAAYEDKTYLPALLNGFTQETGTVTIVRNGEAPEIIDDILLKRATPPADILITPSVAGAWRVAEEGELRPNFSTVVAAMPVPLTDPDRYWTALSYRTAVIAYDEDAVDPAALHAYEDLAAADLRRKLCLSTSSLAINRAVVAMLIHKLGKRDAELAVRGWVANLAQPPFDTQAQLLGAISRGECALGIVSSSAVTGSRLGVHAPAELYFDIEAIGVTRHARNPEAAAALVDWLLTPEILAQHAAQTAALPATGPVPDLQSIMLVAEGLEEAVRLAERARYR